MNCALVALVLAAVPDLATPPPPTPKRPVTDTYYGVAVTDDYRWLEDGQSKEVRAWSDAQNAHARSVLDHLPGVAQLRERLTKILAAKTTSHGSLAVRGKVVFALRRQPPKQQPFLVVLPAPDRPEDARVLLDPNELDKKGTTSIDWFVPSPDGKLVAVSLSSGGSESGDVHLLDAETGKRVDVAVPRVNGGTAGGDLAWAADSRGFYYTRYPRGDERAPADRDFYQQLYFHALGTRPRRTATSWGTNSRGSPRSGPRSIRSPAGCWRPSRTATAGSSPSSSGPRTASGGSSPGSRTGWCRPRSGPGAIWSSSPARAPRRARCCGCRRTTRTSPGRLTKKQNVFDDFAAVLKHLIDQKYTSPEKLAIEGGSNGGLLMGATLTQHPELVRAVVSHVGIYDMLRVELSSNGAFNIPEFGTVKDEHQFRALYAYSPYHHVKDGTKYPAVLFLTGANDPRVDPMQSRKMVARLQAATASGRPVLLRTSAGSGHGLGTALSERIEQEVDVYAFLFDQLGVQP